MNLPNRIVPYGLLLCAVVLTGFLCWGIYSVVAMIEPVTIQANSTLNSIGLVSAEAMTLGAQLNVAVQENKPKVDKTMSNLQATSENLKQASAGLNKAVTELNQPCGPGHPCGTIAELNEAIRAAHHAIGQVEVAANHEDKNLSLYDKQEADLFTAAQGSVTKLNGAVDAFTGATNSLNDLLKNKAVTQTFTNISSITTDAAQAVHDFFHPTWPKRIANWLEEAGMDAGKLLIP